MTTQAVQDILAERRRQIEVEGFDELHDDDHRTGELAAAAACYAHPVLLNEATGLPVSWPFDKRWWKPKTKRENCVRAAALLMAEVERLDRIADRTRERG